MRLNGLRSMRGPPNSISRARIALLNEGCETPHCSAARVKLRCSHSARKYRSWEISNPPSICGCLKACRPARHRAPAWRRARNKRPPPERGFDGQGLSARGVFACRVLLCVGVQAVPPGDEKDRGQELRADHQGEGPRLKPSHGQCAGKACSGKFFAALVSADMSIGWWIEAFTEVAPRDETPTTRAQRTAAPSRRERSSGAASDPPRSPPSNAMLRSGSIGGMSWPALNRIISIVCHRSREVDFRWDALLRSRLVYRSAAIRGGSGGPLWTVVHDPFLRLSLARHDRDRSGVGGARPAAEALLRRRRVTEGYIAVLRTVRRRLCAPDDFGCNVAGGVEATAPHGSARRGDQTRRDPRYGERTVAVWELVFIRPDRMLLKQIICPSVPRRVNSDTSRVAIEPECRSSTGVSRHRARVFSQKICAVTLPLRAELNRKPATWALALVSPMSSSSR